MSRARAGYRVPLLREVARTPVRGPEDIRAVLAGLGDCDREHFAVIHLSARHDAVAVETVSIGSLNASIVHPREVFRSAVSRGSAALVLAHNHPSGDPAPSQEDDTITARLVKAGELLGIEVLDHVILAPGGGLVSFRAQGKL